MDAILKILPTSAVSAFGLLLIFVLYKFFDAWVSKYAEKENPLFALFGRRRNIGRFSPMNERRKVDDPSLVDKLIGQWDKQMVHYDRIANAVDLNTDKITKAIELMVESNSLQRDMLRRLVDLEMAVESK